MQKYREQDLGNESKKSYNNIVEKELNMDYFSHHFTYEEFVKFPLKLRVQIIYSMFDVLHKNCGEALDKLFPYLFSLKDKRYDLYAKILFLEDLRDEEPCLSKFLKLIKKEKLSKKKICNKNKIKKAIEYLRKNEIKGLESLYYILPRHLYHKLRYFDKYKKDMNFEDSRTAWIWFLEKELEL